MPSSPNQNGNLASTSKGTLEKPKLNFSRSALFHMKTPISLKYFENDCRETNIGDITKFQPYLLKSTFKDLKKGKKIRNYVSKYDLYLYFLT